MSKVEKRTDWAEDEDENDPSILPAPAITKNADGTETHVSFRWREDGKKVKTTRIIKRSIRKETVNPRIAERRGWAKFGDAKKDSAGPQSATTSVGENIELNLRQNFSKNQAPSAEEPAGGLTEKELQKEKLKGATVKCRICNGEHFTARCPYKGTMAPDGEPAAGEPAADPMAMGDGAAATVKGKYVAPGARAGASGGGERMGGKFERDDLATLRVTNVSEYAEEQDLREMFDRWGRVTRVFLAKDRETGRAKGFAFVSFADRDDAAKACVKMDGWGYNNLILRVEFAKKTT